VKLAPQERRRRIPMAVVLGLSLSLIPLPAVAEEAASIEQGAALVSKLVPEVMEQTDASAPVERAEDGPAYSTGFGEVTSAERSTAESLELNPDDETAGRISPDVTIEPEYFTEYSYTSEGIDLWQTDSDSVVGYVQPLPNGLRFMTAIADANAPEAYSYALNLPPNSTMKANVGGFGLWASDGASLGQLLEPWAIDASGRRLATSFEWDGAILTQHVDLDDASIVFPVLIDPAWTYRYEYNILDSTPEQVRAKLQDCFNCWFPVEGAPAQYPVPGQFLPLVVRPFWGAPISWNFNCTFGFDAFENWGTDPNFGKVTWYVYTFNATSSHVDGAGSTITFEFSTSKFGGTPGSVMTVGAYITNDDPMGIGRPAYEVGANYNWTQFAHKLSGIAAG
jgi:hypothetical protein